MKTTNNNLVSNNSIASVAKWAKVELNAVMSSPFAVCKSIMTVAKTAEGAHVAELLGRCGLGLTKKDGLTPEFFDRFGFSVVEFRGVAVSDWVDFSESGNTLHPRASTPYYMTMEHPVLCRGRKVVALPWGDTGLTYTAVVGVDPLPLTVAAYIDILKDCARQIEREHKAAARLEKAAARRAARIDVEYKKATKGLPSGTPAFVLEQIRAQVVAKVDGAAA